MFLSTRWKILAGLALLLGATAVGFAAGRRYPWTFGSSDSRTKQSHSLWTRVSEAPFARYETAVALIRGKVFIFGGFHPTGAKATPRVDVYDPASRSWTRKQDMPLAFTHANAAILRDTVWLAGGFVGDSPGPTTDQVWRYDPERDSWSQGPRLPEPRASGVLVNLDGTLHYFGGWKPDRNTDAGDHWVLTPGAGSWGHAAPLPHPRGHLGGLVLDGKIYAVGGCEGHDPVPLDLNLVQRYDPATDRWEEVAPLPIPRSHIEPSTFAHRNRIVVVGGRSRPNGWPTLSDVTEYDPATNRWTALPSIPFPLLAPVALAIGDSLLVGLGSATSTGPESLFFWMGAPWSGWLPADSMPSGLGDVSGGIIGDRLYLVGERNPATLMLDLANGRWAPTKTLALRPSMHDHPTAEVVGGELYLLGGTGPRGRLVQIYNPERDAWQMGRVMPFPAAGGASAVIGGRIYVAGGMVGDTATSQAAMLEPATGLWTPLTPMPQACAHAASGTDGKRFYVFGGQCPRSRSQDSITHIHDVVQVYDPVTDRWLASGGARGFPAPLPQARSRMGKAVFYRGEFYLFGGATPQQPGTQANGTSAQVDIYDPAANSWRSGPPMPTPSRGIFPLLRGDRIYVAGGVRPGGPAAARVVEVFAP